MQGLTPFIGALLANPAGQLVGAVGQDGREYLLPTAVNAASGTTQPATYVPNAISITGGAVNGASIGVTTPATVRTNNLQTTFTDLSGTPGNVTINSPRGRAAFAAAGATTVVTSAIVTANSTVIVQLGGSDVTATSVRVTAAAGSFTVTANAAATSITPFDFLVVN